MALSHLERSRRQERRRTGTIPWRTRGRWNRGCEKPVFTLRMWLCRTPTPRHPPPCDTMVRENSKSNPLKVTKQNNSSDVEKTGGYSQTLTLQIPAPRHRTIHRMAPSHNGVGHIARHTWRHHRPAQTANKAQTGSKTTGCTKPLLQGGPCPRPRQLISTTTTIKASTTSTDGRKRKHSTSCTRSTFQRCSTRRPTRQWRICCRAKSPVRSTWSILSGMTTE